MNTIVKSGLYFIILLFSSFSLWGNSMQDSADIYVQQANEAYRLNHFEDAVALYTKAVDLQFESSALYYNLGNAYYKSGDNAKALLWYERAKRLAANNEDIIHNINFVQEKLIDKIEVLPEFFIVKLWNSISQLFTANQWAIFSIIFCAIFTLSILIILVIRTNWIRTTLMVVVILALLFTIFTFIFARKETGRYIHYHEGIIIGQVVNVKSTPAEKSSDLFVIHSGLKVEITDKLNEWREVKLPNGEKGWILSTFVEEI